MKNSNKKVIKKRKISIKKITRLIIIILIIILIPFLITSIFSNKEEKEVISIPVQKIELTDYDYYLRGNSTKYEKELAKDLKKILSNEEIVEEEYAKAIIKLFLSDLFTLDTKNSSSDITSSQYVYEDYRETFEIKVKNTLYERIELDLDGTRNQVLPIVTDVEIISITNEEYTYKDEILDENAYLVETKISYKEDLGYHTDYKIMLVKNENLLEVVSLDEI